MHTMVWNNRTHLGNLLRVLHLIITFRFCVSAGECPLKGCDLAYASFRIPQNTNYTYIGGLFDNQFSTTTLQLHNPETIINDNYIRWGDRIKIPLSCDCLTLPNGTPYLGHVFNYTVRSRDTYFAIAHNYYSNLTSSSWLQAANVYEAKSLPIGKSINVSINCSCGDEAKSKDYGLFLTYPLMNSTSDTLSALSKTYNVSPETLRKFNPGVTFRAFNDEIVYIPVRDLNGSYRPLYKSNSAGLSKAAIVGICIATIIAVFVISLVVYLFVYKRSKTKDSLLLQLTDKNGLSYGPGSYQESVAIGGVDVTVDKSVEFTYEELALATDNFSLANKIGEGGFGCVYYAELHGEKAAIKKMDMKATHEFMAELKVLTHVHHLNLVRLIGFCTEECLFLVYEFIENGTLSQHLRGSGMEPLSWPSRVQIALDSARGLEYIHEHTVPVYIHRDIKSANILIDKNYRAKVADFGLTKLTEVGGQSASLPTRLVGTFGYMPPEYAQYGDVSPKVDVYAFGVVLYEIISAKEAIVRTNDASAESKGLVMLFEDVWRSSNGHEILRDLVDPRLGNNYPLESVWKMAQLAKACTNEEAELRPNMRTVVVALMTLSSSTEEWDDGSLSSIYQSKGHARLTSGRRNN